MYQHPGAQNNTISQLSAIHPMGAPWQPPEGQLPFPKICDLLDVYNTNETDLTNMVRASIRMYASRNDSPLHLKLLGDGHGGNPPQDATLHHSHPWVAGFPPQPCSRPH